jgi:predicted transcriptional regulator
MTDSPLNGSTGRQLVRDLAAGEVRRAQLARQLGVSASAVTQFAQKHEREIEAIKARLQDEFAGLWIADKAERIASYQADLEMSLDSDRPTHFEQIRTRTQIKQAVAEELGQLPPRTQVVVQAITHIIENVNLEDLR